MYPRKLNKNEEIELQEQLPKIEEYKHQRLQNKIEMMAIVFFSIVLIGVLYLFYLSWNYVFVGI